MFDVGIEIIERLWKLACHGIDESVRPRRSICVTVEDQAGPRHGPDHMNIIASFGMCSTGLLTD
jgi:hypothetical protein